MSFIVFHGSPIVEIALFNFHLGNSCPPEPLVHWLILAQRGAPAHDAERRIFMIEHVFNNIESMGDTWAYYNLSVGMNMTYNNAPLPPKWNTLY